MKRKMSEMQAAEKVLFLLQIIVSSAVIIFSALKLFGVLDLGLSIAVPLLGVYVLLQGICEWKQSKAMATVSFAVTLFVFACTAAVWFL